jgi:hypothetical protein
MRAKKKAGGCRKIRTLPETFSLDRLLILVAMFSSLCLMGFTPAFFLQPGVPTFLGFSCHLPGLGYDRPYLLRVHPRNSL